ncbi:substrate-binding periplasmic protein [Gilvimarinus xylanilyticus]|uniref:Transporter substrate-binding domain-containing protein n=1 Tax=Gilvimarinus xylanilyticus TaxID=2944139 RepID=A0A9X2I7R2_9GAMM|nr:transporter substrate-binding domain-containing protein [Gilvimarinus xylanilyticus]MCP8900982.1 transporter substrate-binding domain-containing protein [Gilvimarinus xylanilyticus]
MLHLRSAVVGVILFTLAAGGMCDVEPSANESIPVRYPEYVGDDPVFSRLTEYFADLLDLALSKTGRHYTLVPIEGQAVTDRRAMRNLDSGVYDVNFMHTNPDRERTLRPVYFPMFKGLAGWRLLLVREADASRFGRDLMPSEFKRLRAGLGHDWPDVRYMKANGYEVVTSVSRDSLVNMLMGNRVDYVSRSVIEVWDEMAHYRQMPLKVACCVAIHYPSAFYMFTARKNEALAELLSEGLHAAFEDGSFDRLFLRYYGEAIERSRLSERRIYPLHNPDLSDSTPLEQSGLWFQP